MIIAAPFLAVGAGVAAWRFGPKHDLMQVPAVLLMAFGSGFLLLLAIEWMHRRM